MLLAENSFPITSAGWRSGVGGSPATEAIMGLVVKPDHQSPPSLRIIKFPTDDFAPRCCRREQVFYLIFSLVNIDAAGFCIGRSGFIENAVVVIQPRILTPNRI